MFPLLSDVCFYCTKDKDLFTIVYVDDFQLRGPNLAKIDMLKYALQKDYRPKSVNTDFFPGIHISILNKGSLRLSQGHHALKLLIRYELENCKQTITPLEHLMEPISSVCSTKQLKEYNSMICGLQCLTNKTCSDLVFAVNHPARFLVNISKDHTLVAKRILRYISKVSQKGITFSN